MSTIHRASALLLSLLLWREDLGSQSVAPQPAFTVFDATLYKQKPALARYGMKPVAMVFWGMIWPKGGDITALPDRELVRKVALQTSHAAEITVLDLEQWPQTGTPSAVAESVRKYQTVLEWFQEAAPSAKFGYYGVAPMRDYWASLQPVDSPRYLAWQKLNDGMASIARSANILCPSVYTFEGDPEAWSQYAIAQIREARRYGGGKPVYIFLWPQYHPADKSLSGTYLSGEYWRRELEIGRRYADGIVIWGGYQMTWDEEAPWWLETKKFLQSIAVREP
jgi:hypothetical protein